MNKEITTIFRMTKKESEDFKKTRNAIKKKTGIVISKSQAILFALELLREKYRGSDGKNNKD